MSNLSSFIGGHDCWEDNYAGEVFATYDELSASFAAYCEDDDLAYMNVPVWINYDSEDENEMGTPTICVGIMGTRKGRAWQNISPATPEQAQDLRVRMMRIWAHRADAMFDRYNGKYLGQATFA